jgi:alpha-1,2-mannosyltransferase
MQDGGMTTYPMTPRIIRAPMAIVIIAFIASLYAWAIFATTFNHPGLIGPDYDTPGTDYMVLHGGIATAFRHDFALLFDATRFTNFLNTTYQAFLAYPLQYRPWIYPPSFLILLLPFAPFGFLTSYLLFQGVTAAMLAAALCIGAPRGRATALLAACVLFSPAASVNVLWGQGAFLTCSLLVAGTRLLPRHGILAGIAFGLLSIKPQHALLVPVMVFALGNWRAALSACLTAMALAAASAALFGGIIWLDWLQAIRHFPPVDWDSSLQTCALLLGLPRLAVTILMVLALIGGSALVFLAFRKPVQPDVRLAILLAAGNLAAPHTGPYDTLMLVIAVGLALRTHATAETSLAWTLGLCIWLLPLLSQPLHSPIARGGPLLTVLLLAWLFRMGSEQNKEAVLF